VGAPSGTGRSQRGLLLAALGLVVARYTGEERVPVVVSPPEGESVRLFVDVDDDATAADHVLAAGASLARDAGHAGERVTLGASVDRADVSVHVDARDGWRVEVGASGEARPPAGLEAFAEDYLATVEELGRAPEAPLAYFRGMSPARRRLLDDLNDTARPLPSATVDALFREQARRTPDAVAVNAGDGRLTYAELARAAAVQARHLAEAGAGPGDLVLICLERSLAEIVAILGVLWIGAAYVGVDARLPGGQLAQIVSRARATGGCFRVGPLDAPELEAVPEIPAWGPSWRGASGVAPASEDPAGIAYVAFTSGSTGEPKGIRIPHRAVVRLVLGVEYAPLGGGERVLRFAPLSFDASTFEIWGPLLNGGRLEVHPPGPPSPGELGGFLAERGITVAWLTSGLFALLAEHAPDSLGGLRCLLTGGDVVSPQHVAHVLARHPGLVVVNGYGPTESTTFATVHAVRSAADVEDPLPIGRPIPNTTVHVLDRRRRLVPPGGVGELYIGGAGLAAGYLGDGDADAGAERRFGRLSPDVPERLYRSGDVVRLDARGRLRFLGRNDDQVKIRGFRVELAEIRRALLEHPGVRDAVVVASGDSTDRRLVAACVPAAGSLDVAGLRDHLAARLPEYMVPALWAEVGELPVTATGKIDRASLAAAARPVPAPEEPRAEGGPRAEVAAIFAEVLGFEMPAGADDFFAVGGDSLRAFRVLGLVEERLGIAPSLRDFLLDPTLSGLVRVVERELKG
jgi:amino acid adenylation domain-containing protein